MNEIEVWSEMSKEIFDIKLHEFTERFGEPQKKKRMAFRFGFNDFYKINTRIRMTNGYPEIMQKTGDVPDAMMRTEIDYPLEKDAQKILDVTNFFKKILMCRFEEIHFFLLQFDNYVWRTQDFEVKISYQLGNEAIYHFEVEMMANKGQSAEENEHRLQTVCDDLGLEADFSVRDNDFWEAYNKRANIDVRDWSDEQLLEVINSYLDC